MRDYETLCQIITQWNANRLDLFVLTLPNEVSQSNSFLGIKLGTMQVQAFAKRRDQKVLGPIPIPGY